MALARHRPLKKGESHKVFDMMERLKRPDERTSGTEPVAVHDHGE